MMQDLLSLQNTIIPTLYASRYPPYPPLKSPFRLSGFGVWGLGGFIDFPCWFGKSTVQTLYSEYYRKAGGC